MHKTEKKTIDQDLFSLCDIDKITLKIIFFIENEQHKRQIRRFFSE